ncbi:hypothetical protein [Paracoccus ravus]|uniref:hypothetical protein n=1 Tax=Paracoccus ravus TaxID=2447760 RepID=UPI001ADC6BAD|nr:hypothetical protein [Paracoccus ravus]
MKDDLNASEKRLIAALDRLDNFIDRSAGLRKGMAGADPEAEAESQAHIQRLSDELEALRASHSSAVTSYEARLAVMNERLSETEERAGDLLASNEALIAANRALSGASGAGEDPARAALEAEIQSLRATRSAELQKLGEIMDSLDRMMNLQPRVEPLSGDDVPATVESPMPLEHGMTADLTESEEQRG